MGYAMGYQALAMWMCKVKGDRAQVAQHSHYERRYPPQRETRVIQQEPVSPTKIPVRARNMLSSGTSARSTSFADVTDPSSQTACLFKQSLYTECSHWQRFPESLPLLSVVVSISQDNSSHLSQPVIFVL